ncbi:MULTISPECIES: PDGLE domain-containing protein [unclassified Microbacterium]|uniref:PDGLE domain-containing protein n=1 Tax=unclassified Microbacterium TaxID=2609290 RepID=UPI00214AA01A|nr:MULTISPECIES: PDGLE domain-containing protein [unclassified Microbacterium]MCR2810027.1 PDGLE domain-containing protein [Microbacterium sp. zg.B185]WIM20133.1 PDGLE domain-containing protein [Microbacterium sp. zg-B185]
MTGTRPGTRRISTTAFTIAALSVALLIACGLSVWASTQPDGLEFVAETVGFDAAARESMLSGSPLADYGVAAIDQPWLSVAVAGACGCALTFGLAWLLGRLASSRRDRP